MISLKLLTRLGSAWLITLCVFLQADGQTPVPAISTFIKPGAVVHKGMFNVYIQEDKYFLEIPDSLLGRDILTSISIISGSAQRKRNPAMRFGFAGDAVNDKVIRFSKESGEKIFLAEPSFIQSSDSTSIYYRSLKTALVPGLLAFDVLAQDNGSTLIDITKVFNGDSEFFSLKGASEELKLGSFEPQKSKILGVSVYSNNIIFRSVKSYAPGAPPQPAPVAPGAAPQKQETFPTIWEVGASWYLLPKVPMVARYADKRLGYFQTALRDYDQNPNQDEMHMLANRWRIEPKEEDMAKFLAGELVEPKKPIVFYIDRNTPAYLVPYFIDGVNQWRKSFEKIGFKNAITGKLAPTSVEDPDFTMEDARYSYISYKPSEIANAYGPQVVDPRSGEILSSHIAVFHNIMELLQRWYFSMCAVTDPSARKIPMDPKVIGALLKNVITHEVGHTLGLRHNFAGSSSYPVDSLRNRDYVRKHGFGPSVMDYMRFNYAAQPEDKMEPEDLLPVIGVYDDYAIEWGYRYFPQFKKPAQAATFLNDWVSQKRKDPRYFYYEESNFFDPRVQSEDIGDNNMKANALGVENLKKTMLNIEQWGKGTDDDYVTLRSMYRAVQGRYYIYLQHVVKNIAGVFADNPLRTELKSAYTPISLSQQKEAMAYLDKYFFTEQKWLYPKNIVDKTGFRFESDIEETYADLFGKLFYKYPQFNNIKNISAREVYAVQDYLGDLHKMVFKDLTPGKPISRYNMMFHRLMVNQMLVAVVNRSNFDNGISTVLKKLLQDTKVQVDMQLKQQTDILSKSHLQAISHMIEMWQTGKDDIYLTK